jgi:hypothetical protein
MAMVFAFAALIAVGVSLTRSGRWNGLAMPMPAEGDNFVP